MELLEAAQGEAYEGYERSIDVHIKNLRQKLGDAPRDPTYILTVLWHRLQEFQRRSDTNETQPLLETHALLRRRRRPRLSARS